MDNDKTIMLMDHMIHHNEHHADDFKSLANDLKENGANDAAKLAESAAKDVEAAVAKLVEAKELYINNK